MDEIISYKMCAVNVRNAKLRNYLNDTQLEKLKSKNFFCLQSKNFRQINDIRDTGPDTENTDHGPDMDFYGPLVNQSE
jgi:hypothetical protein